ncbi:phosphonopyruvate decarboxylase [uncultured Draconibacterium sp.]|uniref:phosphonopyruvate decarboxylase n=1 Tax=uncultured Draconibacterium sp. TaxID=1573823 RepID=UPI0025E1AA19|nr:phosphonopyruvate decarboxylase [uncultured Draconibacterium sp.]
MIDIRKFISELRVQGIEFITGVPDTLLNDFCLNIEESWDKDKHVIAANEGNSIGLAAGYHVSTNTIPFVYMQNSGIGNCVNPLLSLTEKNVYSIPMILLIGWRGEPGIKDHPQHTKQGELTITSLEAMGVQCKVVENDDDKAIEDLKWAVDTARKTSHPVALIARKGVFHKAEKSGFNKDDRYELSREDAIKVVVENVPKNTLFVASTGRSTRELFEVRNILGQSHKHDFLNVGAMGHTSSIALGLAIANKDRLVVCIDGDSSTIMHLGAMTTMGKVSPKNLLHIVLNNGVHESVGGQKSAGQMINLTEIAKNCGYKNTLDSYIAKKQELITTITSFLNIDGPNFIDFHIQKGIRKDMPPLKFSHLKAKNEFMNNILK